MLYGLFILIKKLHLQEYRNFSNNFIKYYMDFRRCFSSSPGSTFYGIIISSNSAISISKK